jgi:hypothetical protein
VACASAALWVGLLYDADALDAAWDLAKSFSREERHALRHGVPQHALKLPFRQYRVRDLAQEVLTIAAHGLRRARRNAQGADERIFLEPLLEIAATGKPRPSISWHCSTAPGAAAWIQCFVNMRIKQGGLIRERDPHKVNRAGCSELHADFCQICFA